MNNNSPRGQTSQNPSSMNNARAVHRPAGHGVMYHNNGMQVQTANYVQPQAPRDFVQMSQPHMSPYPPLASPYGGPQPSQASPPPGFYTQNNAMGTVYVPSPFNNPASLPHPAAGSHYVANVWNHPPEGIQPTGHIPNIGMHFPNNVTGWGSNPSHNIPTSQAPSTAGVPAYNYDFVTHQHGTFQRGQVQHEQAQRGQAQHGQAQQRCAKRRKVQRGTGQHASGSNTHGPNQPSAGTPSVNIPAAPSYPAQAPVHHAIDAITAEFLRTADPRGAQFGPGDIVDQIWLEWFLGQPQQDQAMVQHPGPPGPAGTPGDHVPDGSMPTDAPFSEDEISRYIAVFRDWLAQAPES
ncbi:hypothetical protein LA080_015566 [Diaporthe eres]|nr:hypothetical protein LA080_015566 [Diaporthe eres]